MEASEDNDAITTADKCVSIKYIADNEAVAIVLTNPTIGTILTVSVAETISQYEFQDDFYDEFDTFNGMSMEESDPFAATAAGSSGNGSGSGIGNIELIGQIPLGFSDGSWSPDNELFILACNNGRLLCMTKSFDIISDVAIVGDSADQASVTEANPYTHLEGTEQHKQVLESKNNDTFINTHTETDAYISWRGDGQCFVVSSMNTSTNKRTLRVWSRQLKLQSVSEPVVGLTETMSCSSTEYGMNNSISWRPSGNYIAITERIPVAVGASTRPVHQVTLYERNGLKRYDFCLDPPSRTTPQQTEPSTFVVLGMCWSSDSTVLTIYGYDSVTKDRIVQLWTTNNYHWYLKKQYNYPVNNSSSGNSNIRVEWQTDRASRMIIVLDSQYIHIHDYVMDINTTTTPLSTAAVVNGYTILLTHLQKALIPPPLAARALLVDQPCNEVSLCNSVNSIDYLQTTELLYKTPDLTSSLPYRLDLISPITALTNTNSIILFTDAIEPKPWAQPAILTTPYAPYDHPERAMGLTKVSHSYARIASYITLPFHTDANTSTSTTTTCTYKNLQWLDCTQWRNTHMKLTNTMAEYLRTNPAMKVYGDVAHVKTNTRSSSTTISGKNIIMVTQTTPDTAGDAVVFIEFNVYFQYNAETNRIELHCDNVETFTVTPPYSSTSATGTGDEVDGTSSSTTAMMDGSSLNPNELTAIPHTVSILNNCLSRVSFVNPGLPYPIIGKDNSMNVFTNTNTDNTTEIEQWLKVYKYANSALPWVAVHTCTGTVYRVDMYNKTIQTLSDVAPVDSPYMSIVDMGGKHVVVAKDITNRLYIDNTLVAPQCMTYSVASFTTLSTTKSCAKIYAQTGHGQTLTYDTDAAINAIKSVPYSLLPSYLLITVASQQHALFCLDLRRTLQENIDPMNNIRTDPHMMRYIERGSHIVAPISDILRPRLIFQMPRGNLELVTPRVLGLAAIFVAIQSKQYLQAFLSMRANRIDFNLLFDHDPEGFEANIIEILQQLKTPENIALFVSNLTDEDCTKTQFPRYHTMFGSKQDRNKIIEYIKQTSIDMHDGSSGAGANEYISFESNVNINQFDNDMKDHFTSASRNGSYYNNSMMSGNSEDGIPAWAKNMDFSSFGGNGSNTTTIDETTSTTGADSTSGMDMDMDAEMLQLMKGLQSKSGTNTSKKELKDAKKGQKVKSTDSSFSNRLRIHKQNNNGAEDQEEVDLGLKLGEEANAMVSEDGTGTAVLKQLSRVEHWGTADLDIRHVYNNAEAVMKKQQEEIYTTNTNTNTNTTTTTYDYDLYKKGTYITNEDGTKTYVEPVVDPNEEPKKYKSKINFVCELILTNLHVLDQDPGFRHYLPAALSAHLRKSPPDFKNCMKLVSVCLKLEEKEPKPAIPKVPVSKSTVLGPRPASTDITPETVLQKKMSVENALKYILVIADPMEIWKASLELYELQLAASVARHSGQDPKRFLALLTNFKKCKNYGPELTVTQTLPEIVKSTVKKITTMYQLPASAVLPVEEYSFTNEQFNTCALPEDIGASFQNAVIDVHLERFHHAVSHYADAVNRLSEILESLKTKFNDDATTTTITKQDMLLYVKCYLLISNIRKTVLEYMNRYNLHELVVLLYKGKYTVTSSFTGSSSSTDSTSSTEPQYHAVVPPASPHQDEDEDRFYTQLFTNYAQWLHDNQRYEESATAYILARNTPQAVVEYTKAGMYEYACTFISYHTSTFLDTKTLYGNIIEQLIIDKKYKEAASIRRYYLDDVKGAVKILLSAEEYKTALQYTNTKELMDTYTIPKLIEIATSLIEDLPKRIELYKSNVLRLRIVRFVKLIIFGAMANLPQALALWNQGIMNAGGGVNEIPPKPMLMLRLPGDDVLEFIITGRWRGVQTGLCADGTGAGSIANYSLASGASLASIAPSVAASLMSLQSTASTSQSLASMMSGMSIQSNTSVLSAASEQELSVDEKRLLRHMKKSRSRKAKKKIREGDPREELDVLLNVQYYTLGPKRKQRMYELLQILQLLGQQDLCNTIMNLMEEYMKVMKIEESTPMPTIQGLSEWQQTNVANYFNWPECTREDEDVIAARMDLKRKEREAEEKRRIESQMKAQQKKEKEKQQSGEEEGSSGSGSTDTVNNKSGASTVSEFNYKDWRMYTPCNQYAPTSTVLLCTDSGMQTTTRDAMLAYYDQLALVPTKYTTNMREKGNAPKAREI